MTGWTVSRTPRLSIGHNGKGLHKERTENGDDDSRPRERLDVPEFISHVCVRTLKKERFLPSRINPGIALHARSKAVSGCILGTWDPGDTAG